jgi:hypothetical protein
MGKYHELEETECGEAKTKRDTRVMFLVAFRGQHKLGKALQYTPHSRCCTSRALALSWALVFELKLARSECFGVEA